MKITVDWTWILQKVRIAFLLGVFYILYIYVAPVFAFMWVFYFLLNDLSDIETTMDAMKEAKEDLWRNTLHKRKDF